MVASPYFFCAPPDIFPLTKRICRDTRFCSIPYSADRIVRASLASYFSLRQRLRLNRPPVQEMLP
jgi:hypothetical protein